MAAKPGKVAAAAFGLLLVGALAYLIFSVRESGVALRWVDKRLKIYSFQYFPGATMDFTYPTQPRPPSKLRVELTLLAQKFGLYHAPKVQRPVWSPLNVQGPGPALVVLAQIAGGESHWLELVAEDGEIINTSAPGRALVPETNVFLWNYTFYEGGKRTRVAHPLTNGVYRLRFSAEPNDLAIIRVKQ